MRLLVLGPVSVTAGGETITLAGDRRRMLLATLLAAGGEPVSVDRLVDALWGSRPPASAVASLRSHLSRLRGELDAFAPGSGEVIVTSSAGYRLTIDEGDVDAARIVADAGFGVAIHAMGNGGMQRALDAIEGVRTGSCGDGIARVEHATLLSDEQLERLRQLEATAVVQPGFRETLGRNVAELRFDDLYWMPFGRLTESGVALAASSDHPCGPSPPLTTSVVASDTPSSPSDLPGERLSYDAWLEAWTRGAAYAGDQTDERGRLAPGLMADLVVLDGPLDPETPPAVAQTWVRGRLVHHDGPPPRRTNLR